MQKMQKGSPKLLAGNIGKSTETVQPINNQADVAQSLRNKGINSQKADSIAEAITARLTGKELNRNQRNILRSALESPTVQSVVSEYMKKKTDGIDNAQNNVYDGNIFDGLTDEESTALQNLSDQDEDAFSNHGEGTVTATSAPHPVQSMGSEGIYADDSSSERILGNGQSLDDMAKLYAEKVHSNRKWRWRDAFPNASKLSKGDKAIIKKRAIEKGLIPNVPIKVVKDSNKKTYRYVDFDAAGLIKEKMLLPKYLWSETDKVQFKWLDDQIGGRPKGYTWHHAEINGQMELVPTGVHRVYHHNGGRTVNHWAYRKGGR